MSASLRFPRPVPSRDFCGARWVVCAALTCACSAPAEKPVASPVEPSVNAAAVNDGARAEPLVLQPGELAEFAIDAAGKTGVRLATPAGDERFVLVLGSTRFERGERSFGYRLSVGETERSAAGTLSQSCAFAASDAWKNRALSNDPAPTGPAPVIDSTRELWVASARGVSKLSARAISVGEHATIWVDTTHPSSLDAQFAAQFLDDFEHVILPRSRQIFGTESDIDRDGRIQLVFSPVTRARGVAFFTGCDLLKLEGCEASNQGEYLYLTPPDAINPPYNTPNAIKEILTHELGHLLHFKGKVLRNKATTWADGVFLSEGVGALAQDVVGYQAGNLYVTKAGLDGIDGFSLGSVFDARRPEDRVDGALRGGAYLFVRYLYDRAGGDAVNGLEVENRGGPAFWRALIEAPEPIGQALFELTPATPGELAMDFFSALVLSGREQVGGVAPKNPCFSFLPTASDPVTRKQRGNSPYATFHGSQMTGPARVDARAADGQLRAGGVEYLVLDASRGATEVGFSLEVEPGAEARLRVGRL